MNRSLNASIFDQVRGLFSIVGVYIFLGFGSGVFLQTRGFSPFEVGAYAGFVFSGIAQFMVADIALGVSAYSIIIAIFFISARHIFYVLHFSQIIVPMPMWKRVLLSLQLTDETYLYMSATCKRPIPFKNAFTINCICYAAWLFSSIAGVIFSSNLQGLQELEAMDFLAAAMFIGIFYYAYEGVANRILAFLLSGLSLGVVFFVSDFFPEEVVYLVVSMTLATLATAYTLRKERREGTGDDQDALRKT